MERKVSSVTGWPFFVVEEVKYNGV
jgi:hypothetical protein